MALEYSVLQMTSDYLTISMPVHTDCAYAAANVSPLYSVVKWMVFLSLLLSSTNALDYCSHASYLA